MANAKTNCFVDTNMLVYAIDPDEAEKRARVVDLLREIVKSHTLVLSPQSLNECYRVLTDRRRIVPRSQARRYVSSYAPFCIAPSGFGVTRRAWDIQDATGYSWWDCMLLSSALLAGCGVFWSEDMQHGRKLDTMTILSPFEPDLARDLTS